MEAGLFGVFLIVWGVLMKVDSHLRSSPVLHDRSFCSLGVCCACVWFRVGLHVIFDGALCSKYLLIPILLGTMQPNGFMHPLYLIFVVQMEFEAQLIISSFLLCACSIDLWVECVCAAFLLFRLGQSPSQQSLSVLGNDLWKESWKCINTIVLETEMCHLFLGPNINRQAGT